MTNKTEDTSILGKIQKLLTLATRSENEGESQNAMLMAQKLMAKHGVGQSAAEQFEKPQENGVVDEIITNKNVTKIIWWKKNIAATIAKNFRCKCYRDTGGHQRLNSETGLWEARKFSFLRFIGLKSDVEIATGLYKYAIAELKYLAGRFTQSHGNHTAGFRNDYIRGWMTGLSKKFAEQVEENNWQMIVVPDKAVVETYDALGTTTHVSRSRITSSGSGNAYGQGYTDGRQCNLKQQKIAS